MDAALPGGGPFDFPAHHHVPRRPAPHHRPRAVIEDGSVGAIKERYGGTRTLVVDLAEPGPPLVVEGAEVVRVAGPRQWLRFRSDGKLTAARLLARVSEQAAVRDLAIEETAIDDVVRRIYGNHD